PAAARVEAVAPVRRPPPGPVYAGTDLPLARLEPLGPPPSGRAPDDLPVEGPEMAPLLGNEPLLGPDQQGEGGPVPEGQRARQAVGQRFGVDLSKVAVDRSPQGAMEAGRLRARAFTSDRAVVIPPSVGPLDLGPGEALLTHELTHVAQRARFGTSLPGEDTAAGQILERQARAAEMTLNTGATARPVVDAAPGAGAQTTWAGALNHPRGTGPSGAPLPLAAPGPAGVDTDELANTILERLSEITGPAALGAQTITPAMGPAAAPAMAASPVQRAVDYEPVGPPPQSPEPPARPGGRGSLERPTEEDLSNLSRWLYPLIRYRLRGELREDRERAGLLTEHYRRW
nr:DUF4157 domain-containing protein [Actinomycetota bacterium]